ncbi:hypothetical protein ACFLYW_02225 [Thermodesulfobacteriota bacterium]
MNFKLFSLIGPLFFTSDHYSSIPVIYARNVPEMAILMEKLPEQGQHHLYQMFYFFAQRKFKKEKENLLDGK